MSSFRASFFLYLHILLLALWYTSPFYLDWRIVIGTVIAYHIQLRLAHGCLLTIGQFGPRNKGFYAHYLHKLGFHPNGKKLNFVLDYIIPGTMILFALLYQGVIISF